MVCVLHQIPINAFIQTLKNEWRKNHERKKLKKIKENSKNLGNLGTFDRDYIIEGHFSQQKNLGEECPKMQDENLIVNQFKKKVSKALYNLKIDIYRKRLYQSDTEILSDEIVESNDEIIDDYDFLENHVTVMNFKMTIKNDLLYEVLSSMQQYQRDVVYLSFCEKMSDQKIGDRLKISRSNVQRTKQSMKKQIYDAMTGGSRNEK